MDNFLTAKLIKDKVFQRITICELRQFGYYICGFNKKADFIKVYYRNSDGMIFEVGRRYSAGILSEIKDDSGTFISFDNESVKMPFKEVTKFVKGGK